MSTHAKAKMAGKDVRSIEQGDGLTFYKKHLKMNLFRVIQFNSFYWHNLYVRLRDFL